MELKSIKVKRNQRLIYLTNYFVEHPNQLISLSYFADLFDIAKSSLSEDIQFIKNIFQIYELGVIETIAGVAGGVRYSPQVSPQERQALINEMTESMTDIHRILPGNYIQLNDILQNPTTLIQAAKIIAEYYRHQEIDAIMTIETQGVGLAAAVARYLNIEYVVVRRDSNETSGPTISVNYISGSHQIVRKMELAKNSLKAHSRVLIIDDFMRNGGTVNGLISLLKEFDCHCVGTCVFAENVLKQNNDLPPYESLFKVAIVYNKAEKAFELKVETGTVLA